MHLAMAMAIGMVRAHLKALRVEPEDQEDLAQEILLGAWQAMQEGAFRPYPNVQLERALDAWLYGISWRLLQHYRMRAYRRREVAVAKPEACRASPRVLEPLPLLEARSALRCVARRIAEGDVDFQLLFDDPGDCTPANLEALARARGVSSRWLLSRRDVAREVLRASIEHERVSISYTNQEGLPNPLEWNPHASEPEPVGVGEPAICGCGSSTPELVDSGASGVSCSPPTPGPTCTSGWRASG